MPKAALDRFLLHKYGRTWDSVPVPGVAHRDLSKPAVAIFKKLARQGGRLEPGLLRESAGTLIEKLNLVEGAYLKRAAVLLFHPEPDRFFAGAFMKIGYFQSDSELVYHDEVRGDLFTQAQKGIELLLTKYLKAAISYRGIQRIESYPVPREALREAILNALIHRDYGISAPIQIRVYDSRLCIWNPGVLPENMTVRKLFSKHSSHPFNPLVATAFFRAGEIEAWGRGIQRIVDACRNAGAPAPEVNYDPGDLWFEFPFSKAYLDIIHPVGTGQGASKRQGKVPVETRVETPVETRVQTPVKILELLAQRPQMTLTEVATAIGKSLSAVERASAKLVREGRIKHTGPTKAGRWEVTSTK